MILTIDGEKSATGQVLEPFEIAPPNVQLKFAKPDGSFDCSGSPGFEYNNMTKSCDIDVDECETGVDSCARDSQICFNNVGGFECICSNAGVTGQLCDLDVDECLVENICPESAVCVNNFGGFDCRPIGWVGGTIWLVIPLWYQLCSIKCRGFARFLNSSPIF